MAKAATHIDTKYNLGGVWKKAYNDVASTLGGEGYAYYDIDVQQMDCDFLVFSGHKVFGPTGIGVLYGKEKWLEEMDPWQFGGEMIRCCC